MNQRDAIRTALVEAARAIGVPDADPVVERPRDPSHGEWATSLALTLARPLKAKPRDIAQRIVEQLDRERNGISKVEIAGPGFINFRLAGDALAQACANILAEGRRYGTSDSGKGKRVNVEFVSQ